MNERVLVAGASGVIGRILCPLMLKSGYAVFGTTRHEETANSLRSWGVRAVVIDVLDPVALDAVVARMQPDIVIHQLTDLAGVSDPLRAESAIRRNARVRTQGTRNLVRAANAAGAKRLIAQSIAWLYSAGHEPHGEEDPLELNGEGLRAVSAAGVAALEESVLGADCEGLVLRYGRLYGPETGAATATEKTAPNVHVDAAAHAALLALTLGQRGVYNIAESCAYLSSGKAAAELGWSPAFRVTAGE